VQKTTTSKHHNKQRGKGAQAGNNVLSSELQPEGASSPQTDLPSNSFIDLNTQEETPASSSVFFFLVSCKVLVSMVVPALEG